MIKFERATVTVRINELNLFVMLLLSLVVIINYKKSIVRPTSWWSIALFSVHQKKHDCYYHALSGHFGF